MAMSGWRRGPRRRASVFVVTRRLRGVPERQGGTSLTFVTEGLELVPTRVVEVPEVTHIRYTVTGRSKLVLDDHDASVDLVRTGTAGAV